MSTRMTQKELHDIFLEDIGTFAGRVEDCGRKPLKMHLDFPFNRDIKAFIWNCTAPPGGRSIDEYKVQLILENQKRGMRGHFDETDGYKSLIIGYATPFVDKLQGLWVLFELDKHREFAYSANLQVKLEYMLDTLGKPIIYQQKRTTKEVLVMAQRSNLVKALIARMDVDAAKMTGEWEYVSE